MNIEVKSSVKPIDYTKSMKILEKRVHDVFLGNKDGVYYVSNLIIATIPAAVIGFIFNDKIENWFSPEVVSIMLLISGLFIFSTKYF